MENTTKEVVAMEKNIMNEVEARRGAFEGLMDNASNACFDENGNVIVKIGYASTDLLFIDERYQGDRVHIANLVDKWDWRKYDWITVVPNLGMNLLNVVDGQNRTKAAIEKGIKKLPVKIILGVSANEEERLKAEASMFVHQDDQIDRLKPVEKHKALLILGDTAATTLQNALDKYGISYVSGGGRRYGRVLGSYSENLSVAKRHGKDGLEFIYSIIENAKWADEIDGYSSVHVRALTNLYRVHDTKEDREKIAEFLSKKLKDTTPLQLAADARSKYPHRDSRMAATILLDDWIEEAGVTKRAVYTNGDKDVTFIKTSELGKKKTA